MTSEPPEATGVSVVICCHNSAARLPQTLAHLAHQEVRDGLRWEVIVVDNASTDGTSQMAVASWPTSLSAPLRVVHEPRMGVAHARRRGLDEARYELVSFVDDDNWVCPEWVQVVSDIMTAHPDVGACGGFSAAACEVPPPPWFAANERSYAIGAWGTREGDVSHAKGFWTAGCTVRRSAWQQTVQNGFRPVLVGRQGARLAAGEDSEMCFALLLTGWRLWCEPRLRFQHFIPASRLQWKYLRRVHRGYGSASVMLDPYLYTLNKSSGAPNETWKGNWTASVCLTGIGLLYYGAMLTVQGVIYRRPLEGNRLVLSLEYVWARLSELLRNRKGYRSSVSELEHASWVRPSETSSPQRA